MGYVVIEHFCDMQDNSRAYSVGDKFPRDGYKVSQARLDILATGRNALGRPLIKVIEEKKTEETKEIAIPEEVVTEEVAVSPETAAEAVSEEVPVSEEIATEAIPEEVSTPAPATTKKSGTRKKNN